MNANGICVTGTLAYYNGGKGEILFLRPVGNCAVKFLHLNERRERERERNVVSFDDECTREGEPRVGVCQCAFIENLFLIYNSIVSMLNFVSLVWKEKSGVCEEQSLTTSISEDTFLLLFCRRLDRRRDSTRWWRAFNNLSIRVCIYVKGEETRVKRAAGSQSVSSERKDVEQTRVKAAQMTRHNIRFFFSNESGLDIFFE